MIIFEDELNHLIVYSRSVHVNNLGLTLSRIWIHQFVDLIFVLKDFPSYYKQYFSFIEVSATFRYGRLLIYLNKYDREGVYPFLEDKVNQYSIVYFEVWSKQFGFYIKFQFKIKWIRKFLAFGDFSVWHIEELERKLTNQSVIKIVNSISKKVGKICSK